MKFVPHKYQEYAISRIVSQPSCGLFLEMGLGKTVSTLTAIQTLMYERLEVSKVLVIAPKKVAEDTWTTEVEKWDHLYLTVERVLGSARRRKEALSRVADIYVINRENVVWLTEQKNWDFDMVVIDELSSFKSPKAKRFKALKKVRPLASRVVGLTGTPSPNGLLDLWSQVYLLDMGERLGRTVSGYRSRYFDPGRRDGYVVYNWDPKPGAEEAIQAKLSDLCVSMSAEDYLSLPKLTIHDVDVCLPDKVMEVYRRLEREKVLELDGEVITAPMAAAVYNKLLQMANGRVYDNEGGILRIHEEKIEWLREIIEGSQGQPVLVFYNFRHDLEALQEAFPEYRILEEQKDIKDWNAGRIPLLFAQPASMGHGLNIQAGGHIIVWYGLTWSLELYQQANARLYRQGQKEAVIIHRLVARGTVDEQVIKRLENKDATQESLMEAVKARLEDIKSDKDTKG